MHCPDALFRYVIFVRRSSHDSYAKAHCDECGRQRRGNTSVSVAEPPPTGFPLWLQGVPINQWMQIPNTRLVDGDLSLLASIPGAEKGLADAKYGKPVQENGINGQSGGTFRKAGSEFY